VTPKPALAGADDSVSRAIAAWNDARDRAAIPDESPVPPFDGLPDPVDPALLWLALHALDDGRPRHLMQFGLTSASSCLIHTGTRLGPRTGVSIVDHDPASMRILLGVSRDGWMHPQFAPSTAALVLRLVDGKPRPVYIPSEIVPANPFPADAILVEGPPGALGGRTGMLALALVHARPGTLILFGGLSRRDRKAIGRFVERHPDLARIIDGRKRKDGRCVVVALERLPVDALAVPAP
jgi:hypothetical protein